MIAPRKRRLTDGFIKNFSPQTQEKIIFHLNNPAKVYLALIGLGFLCFFHSLFSYYTLLSFSLTLISIFFLLKTSLKQISEQGLINFLPSKFQNFLLNRSLFDVLCDVWFIPKIGLYLKAFFGPFYYEYTPEKALANFEVIGMTRAVTVKGFLNLFPGLKKAILQRPKEKNNNQEGFESDTSSPSASSVSSVSEEEKKDEMSEPVGESNNNQKSRENIQIINNTNFVNIQSTVIFRSEAFKEENVPMIIKGDDPAKSNEARNNKHTISNNKKNKRPPIPKGIISKNPKHFYVDEVFDKDGITPNFKTASSEFKKSFFDESKFGSSIKSGPKNGPNFSFRADIDQEEEMPKTKILSSCKKAEKEALDNIRHASLILDEGVLVTHSWDNQKKYDLKKFEEKKKIDEGEVEEGQQFKGVFNIMNILNEIKKNGILSKINDRFLMKLLGLSSIGLLLQLRYHKKARDWIVNSFMYMGFSMIFVLFGSSLGLLIVKNLKRKGKKPVKNEENKNNE